MKNIHIFLIYLILVSCEPFTENFYTIELNNHSPLSANSNTYIDSRKPWSEAVTNLPNDTLSFYIFAEDTINSYPWKIISTEYKVLKRYDFSVQDLESLKYKISYSTTEQMKNMRMYLPYK